jgi:NTE family protein
MGSEPGGLRGGVFPIPRPMKIGLALGGGAARGLAHLGVLEVLEEAKIPIFGIAGTSFGALCGGIYGNLRSARALVERAQAFTTSELFRRLKVHLFNAPAEASLVGGAWRTIRMGVTVGGGLNRLSIIDDEEYRTVIDSLVPDVAIEELSLPFAAIATDLRASAEVIFTSGSLRRAVMASAAIPGLFPPQVRERALLVDGSWADCVPVGPARALGVDIVVAVDVAPEQEDQAELRRSLEVAWVANTVTRSILKKQQLKLAEVVITPRVEAIHWADFSAFEPARRLGREAAEKALPQIEALLRQGSERERPPKRKGWWRF